MQAWNHAPHYYTTDMSAPTRQSFGDPFSFGINQGEQELEADLYEAILKTLSDILKMKEQRKRLLTMKSDRAQTLVDFMQSLLLAPEYPRSVPMWFRKHVLIALLKLSANSMLYPQCYVLSNIKLQSQENGGGFCDIYKGHRGGQNLCLKVVRLYRKSDSEKLLKIYAREAIIWGQLHHPNIVPLYGIYYLDEARRRVCLVSPWLENGNIVVYLEKNPRAPRKSFVHDITRGLNYLHNQNIVHGDLKGLNVLVDDSLRACIADFGLSTIRTNKTLGLTVTTSEPSGRTDRWAAPELLEDDSRPTRASDIWALGCVFYEILTRRFPFHECSKDIHIVRKLLRGDLPAQPDEDESLRATPSLDRVDSGMWALLTKCWSKEPRDRPSCELVLRELGVEQPTEVLSQVQSREDGPIVTSMRQQSQQFRDAMMCHSGAMQDLHWVQSILQECLVHVPDDHVVEDHLALADSITSLNFRALEIDRDSTRPTYHGPSMQNPKAVPPEWDDADGQDKEKKKWVEGIQRQQVVMRERDCCFDEVVLSEGFFVGPKRVNCAALFSNGRRVVYGTDDGVYISDLREMNRESVKVLSLLEVSQMDVLEDYQLLIVLSERQVVTFPLDALDPRDLMAGLKRAKRISSHTSFFKAGYCLGRVLVCIVKSSQLSSTFKVLEPIDQNVRGGSKPTFKKLLQGGNDTLKPFREFYIPVESTSIHYLKTKMCVGCSRGFEIVDLETLETQGLLDPEDKTLEFVRKRDNLRPMALYKIQNEFLVCYNEFAFYVNKSGRRARNEFMVSWKGQPTGFALHEPYILAFEPNFVEIRHIETGYLAQVIQGSNFRLLFAESSPTSSPPKGGMMHPPGGRPQGMPGPGMEQYGGHPGYGGYSHGHGHGQQMYHNGGGPGGGYDGSGPGGRIQQAPGREEILVCSDDRVFALKPAAMSA